MNLYLIRHAKTEVVEGVPPHEWLLSDEGSRQAAALAELPFWPSVRVIYSSPEAKALGSIEPTVRRFGLPVIQSADLRELERPAGLVLDYQAAVAACFVSPQSSYSGWEPAAKAQARVLTVFREAVAQIRAGEGHVALVSHGLLFSLLLAGLEGRSAPRLDEWRSIPMPGWAVIEVAGTEADAHSARLTRPFQGV